MNAAATTAMAITVAEATAAAAAVAAVAEAAATTDTADEAAVVAAAAAVADAEAAAAADPADEAAPVAAAVVAAAVTLFVESMAAVVSFSTVAEMMPSWYMPRSLSTFLSVSYQLSLSAGTPEEVNHASSSFAC